MSKIVIFSAADAAANLQHSVLEGVALDVLPESRMFAELESRAEDGRIRLWGIQPGERGYKETSWLRLEPPAVAFFYIDGRFRYTARVWAKEPVGTDGTERNPALSLAVWGDRKFELIGYLEDVMAVDVAAEQLKAALGYQPTYRIGRETVIPSDAIQQAVIERFGSAEAFHDAVVEHVGTPPLDEVPRTGLSVGSLGTTYRRENERATAERSDVYEVDPDRVDRGTQAHKRTQNRLAEHLESRGLSPRSHEGSEPPYDLAWEDGVVIFIAEVKSVTRQNEERQLRLALGQILRYEQLLAHIKRKPIHKVIAVEREPTRREWIELCARHDVKLVWPEVFAELGR